jgi:hypothetical protein
MQTALRGDQAPAPGTARVDVINPTADPNRLEFVACNDRLGTVIRTQHQNLIQWFAERGDIVLEGFGILFRKCLSEASRKSERADGMKAMEATARANFDREFEPEPRLERWIGHAVLVKHFPNAKNLNSAACADECATLFTRVDPPKAWNAPEEYALKGGLDYDTVKAFIDRAVKEKWSAPLCKAAKEQLWGAKAEPEDVKKKGKDPIESARSAAKQIMDRIKERKIDPETFFDALQSQLNTYGWSLVKGKDGKGAETLKPIKTAK